MGRLRKFDARRASERRGHSASEDRPRSPCADCSKTLSGQPILSPKVASDTYCPQGPRSIYGKIIQTRAAMVASMGLALCHGMSSAQGATSRSESGEALVVSVGTWHRGDTGALQCIW